jgi:hypothetical protein
MIKKEKELQLNKTQESIKEKIRIIRGQKVMLDTDLAKIYGVPTMRLNEQVRRNTKRFPEDFMFKLTQKEKNEVIANCDNLEKLKFSSHLPSAFTEHGVAMLSSVLNSPQAIQMSIFIVRAFIKMREMLAIDKNLELALLKFQSELKRQGRDIEDIISILKRITDEPIKPPEPIGFVV